MRRIKVSLDLLYLHREVDSGSHMDYGCTTLKKMVEECNNIVAHESLILFFSSYLLQQLND
jgi:hypothetical protein